MSTPDDYDVAAIEGLTALRSGNLDRYLPTESGSAIPLGDLPDEVRSYLDRQRLTDEEIAELAATTRAFEDRPVLPRLKPGEVLDERNSAHEWYSGELNIRSLKAYIAGEKTELTSSCLNYWIPSADEKYAAALLRNVISSEVFYVSEDMARMADLASRSLPEDFTVNEALLPTPSGVIRLEQPRYTLDRRGGRLGTTAIGWRILQATDGPHLMIVSFAHRDDLVDEVNRALWEDSADKWNLISPWPISGFQFMKIDTTGKMEKHDASDTPFTLALLMLFGQKVMVSAKGNVDRPALRRAQRLKLPGSITVIDLRKAERVGDEPSETRAIEWGFRWFVRTHWRHLNKPDDPAAMWCPHHQRKCKLTPIFAYAKNTHRTDLPWKDPDRKLNRLVR